MKVRIKFAKEGAMKFVGHLDMMRYFQKAIRRAHVPVKYSEGFSPHQVMSFASPLGVGLTSQGEYLDIEVEGSPDCQAMAASLNQAMADGVEVLGCYPLEEGAKNAMSLVAAADYRLSFREGFQPEDWESFAGSLRDFYGQKQVMALKKTKKGEGEVDLKPLVWLLCLEGREIFMRLAAGSKENVKPELVMEALYGYLGKTCPPFSCAIHREEIYGCLEGEEGMELVPLSQLGVKVE